MLSRRLWLTTRCLNRNKFTFYNIWLLVDCIWLVRRIYDIVNLFLLPCRWFLHSFNRSSLLGNRDCGELMFCFDELVERFMIVLYPHITAYEGGGGAVNSNHTCRQQVGEDAVASNHAKEKYQNNTDHTYMGNNHQEYKHMSGYDHTEKIGLDAKRLQILTRKCIEKRKKYTALKLVLIPVIHLRLLVDRSQFHLSGMQYLWNSIVCQIFGCCHSDISTDS